MPRILLPRSLIRSTQGVLAFMADDPEQTKTGFEFTSGADGCRYWLGVFLSGSPAAARRSAGR
jgi:hypothetical protein